MLPKSEHTIQSVSAPDPSSVSLVSREMERLCRILNDILNKENSGLKEEIYRWHWLQLLRCSVLEQFSPYQVILQPCELLHVSELSSDILARIVCDLDAYYKCISSEKVKGTKNEVVKRERKRKSEIATGDGTSISISTPAKREALETSENNSAVNANMMNLESKSLLEQSQLSTEQSQPAQIASNALPKTSNKRSSLAKESAARMLQMCLAEPAPDTLIVGVTSGSPSNQLSMSNDGDSGGNGQILAHEELGEELNTDYSINNSCYVTNVNVNTNLAIGNLGNSTTPTTPCDSTVSPTPGVSSGPPGGEHAANIAIGKEFAFMLVSKVRRKVPRNLYVKWARERTRVGGSFVVSRGRGYDFRFPPRELSVPAFQAAFKAAVKKREELYGHLVPLPYATPVVDEDFILSPAEASELEASLAAANLTKKGTIKDPSLAPGGTSKLPQSAESQLDEENSAIQPEQMAEDEADETEAEVDADVDPYVDVEIEECNNFDQVDFNEPISFKPHECLSNDNKGNLNMNAPHFANMDGEIHFSNPSCEEVGKLELGMISEV